MAIMIAKGGVDETFKEFTEKKSVRQDISTMRNLKYVYLNLESTLTMVE